MVRRPLLTHARGVSIGGGGIAPSGAPGTARYLGTELDLGLTWSYAPGLTFDLAGGYMWAGGALATSTVVLPGPTVAPNRHPKKCRRSPRECASPSEPVTAQRIV